MPTRIKIVAENVALTADLNDSPTARQLAAVLPVDSTVSRWGDEVYFPVAVESELEKDARQEFEIGEIGFWVAGKAVAIFFGRTPASRDVNPMAVEPINVIGRVRSSPTILRKVHEGAIIHLEKA